MTLVSLVRDMRFASIQSATLQQRSPIPGSQPRHGTFDFSDVVRIFVLKGILTVCLLNVLVLSCSRLLDYSSYAFIYCSFDH